MSKNLETVVIFGPPASGKTNVAKYLSERFGYELVRGSDIVPDLSARYKAKREIIPDGLFLDNLNAKLASLINPKILFENLPRTEAQAMAVLNWASTVCRALFVVELVLPNGVNDSISRSNGRQECQDCGATFHQTIRPFSDRTCGKSSCPLISRIGDSEELIRQGYSRFERLRDGFLPTLQSSDMVSYVEMPMTGKFANDLSRIVGVFK